MIRCFRDLPFVISRVEQTLVFSSSSRSSSSSIGSAFDELNQRKYKEKGVFGQVNDVSRSDNSNPSNGDGDDEFLHPHWKAMESRVVKRRLIPLTEEEKNKKKGVRGRIPPSEEDVWGQAGVYDTSTSTSPPT